MHHLSSPSHFAIGAILGSDNKVQTFAALNIISCILMSLPRIVPVASGLLTIV